MITGKDRIKFLKREVRRLREQVALQNEQLEEYQDLFEDLMEIEDIEDDSNQIVPTELEQKLIDAITPETPAAQAFNRQRTTSDLIKRARDDYEDSVIEKYGKQAVSDDEVAVIGVQIGEAKAQEYIERARALRAKAD